MVEIDGNDSFSISMATHIENPQAQNIKFSGISFDCNSITDADGRVFVRQDLGEIAKQAKLYLCL